MKELKDYLHLYLGCNVRHRGTWNSMYVLSGVFSDGSCKIYDALAPKHTSIVSSESLRPILRHLSDMKEEEWKSIMNEFSIDVVLAYNSYIRWGDKPKHILILENRLQTNKLSFNDGMILLRKHFDLFGLIEAGLAIDKTKMNQP